MDVVLAVPDLALEPELVTSAPGCGVRVVRRCVDAVDLLAAAAIDPDVIVVLSAGLPRLSADVAGRLATGRPVVGLAGDPLDATALGGLGATMVVPVGASANLTWGDVRAAVASGGPPATDPAQRPSGAAGAGVWPTGVWEGSHDRFDEAPAAGRGRIVAVWGPMGAPGRTTVAIGLAESLADRGDRVCLVDADTYAPSVALHLGMVGDNGGLVRACRQADNGLLDPVSVVTSTRRIRGSWHVLTGVPRAERWSDLGPVALDRVWQCLRSAFEITVVDVGFCLEDDDSPAAWASRRNAAALTALAVADRVIAVADASALGAARLVAAWPTLAGRSSAAATTIVRNRSGRRHAPVGWDEALREFGVQAPIHVVPADAAALSSCWARGRSLGEGARRSALRRSLVTLAEGVVSG